jgi:hypothetical protein
MSLVEARKWSVYLLLPEILAQRCSEFIKRKQRQMEIPSTKKDVKDFLRLNFFRILLLSCLKREHKTFIHFIGLFTLQNPGQGI